MLEVRGAHSEELEAAALCIGAAFAANNRDHFPGVVDWCKGRLTHDTRFAVENTRVAVLDGQVVCAVQIADRQMLLEGLPVLGQWAGSLYIESEVGHISIEALNGQLTLTEEADRATPSIQVRLTHAQTIDPLFGKARHSNLLVKTIGSWEAAVNVLAALFPAREYRWYPKDAL